MDKWGVTQSADQDTSGMWIKYGTSEACADCFRQPMTGFPKSGWLSCCTIEMSRKERNIFFFSTVFHPHATGILACALSDTPFIDNL